MPKMGNALRGGAELGQSICRISRQTIVKWRWLYVMMGCCATPLELQYDDMRHLSDQNRD